jgi:uncharacterized protein
MKSLVGGSAILWIVLAAVCVSAEPIASLRPTNYVNDFAGVLDASTQAKLNSLCQQVDQRAQAQIAVVTVKSLDGQEMVSYAVALYQKWGIGAKGKDRGVVILVATQDRKFGASVGYGLEPILPDGKVGGFRREAAPYLTKGDYASGLSLMTSLIADVIAADAGVTLDNQMQRPPRPRSAPSGGLSPFVIILILIFIVIPILGAIFRGGGRPGGGGGSGLLSGLLWSMLFSNMGGGRGYGGGGFGGGFGGGGGGGGFGGFGGGSTGGGGSFGGY